MDNNNPEEPIQPEGKRRFHRLRKVLSFFGIHVSRKRRLPVYLNKIFFLWMGGLAILFMAVGFGLYKFSTSTTFCHSCHIMEPYYQAWQNSEHYKKATCVDCHYPPPKNLRELLWLKFQATAQVVKYVTRTYSSKPFADIQDASCLRSGCHSTRLLEGRLVTQNGIKFDHRPHLAETRRGRQLRCVSCHSQVVVGKHIEVTYDTCFLCHFRENGEKLGEKPTLKCTQCHEVPTKSFQLGNVIYNHKDFVIQRGVGCQDCHLNVTRGKGLALEDRCFTCHNQPEKIAKYSDMPFIHENHVTKHHVACLHCHQEMLHGLPEWEEIGIPTTPPTETVPSPETQPLPMRKVPSIAFECSYCHQEKHLRQIEMYTGQVKALGLPDIPSPMYLVHVDCIGCHYQEEGGDQGEEPIGRIKKASEEACVKCHGPSYRGIWQETATEFEMTLSQLEKNLETSQSLLQKSELKGEKREAIQKYFDEAKQLHQFVSFSRGEHNIYLASVILRKEDKLISQVGEELGTPLPNLSSLPLLSGSYCAKLCHTTVGVKVPPDEVEYEGKPMPHAIHVNVANCVECHEIGTHKEAPLRKSTTDLCRNCHLE